MRSSVCGEQNVLGLCGEQSRKALPILHQPDDPGRARKIQMVDRYHRLGSNFLNYFSQLLFMAPLLDGDTDQ